MTELRITGDPPRTTVDVTGDPIGSFSLNREVVPCPACGRACVVLARRDDEPSVCGHRLALVQSPAGWVLDRDLALSDICYRGDE